MQWANLYAWDVKPVFPDPAAGGWLPDPHAATSSPAMTAEAVVDVM
jgi:hypothetical protein